MKCRQTSFYVDQDDLSDVVTTVVESLLPEYRHTPHFLGLTLTKAEFGMRTEVIATSFWDDGLEGSDEIAHRFAGEIHRITGTNPTQKPFELLYMEMNTKGESFRPDFRPSRRGRVTR